MYRIIYALLVLAVITSCRKDFIDPEVDQSDGSDFSISNRLVQYQWSEKESDFFDSENHQKINGINQLDYRSEEERNLIFHPELVGLYNEIAKLNEENGFVDRVVEGSGLPVWRFTKIINLDNSDRLLITPLAFPSHPKTTSLIIAKRSGNTYVINTVGRDEVLDTIGQADIYRSNQMAEIFYGYDKFMFQNETEAADAWEHHTETIVNILNGSPYEVQSSPESSPNSECFWDIISVCSDDDTQISWFAHDGPPPSVTGYPIHLDHDGDGILNEDDQDWYDLLNHYGITSEEFQELLNNWWDTNYGLQYGDYWEFWDDYWDQEIWDYEFDWWDIRDAWWEDWFFDGGAPPSDDEPGNEGGDYPQVGDPPPGCFWCLSTTSPVNLEAHQNVNQHIGFRSIRCNWFYILDCGEEYNLENWTDVLINFPCNSCSDEGDPQNIDEFALHLIREYIYDNVDYFQPFNISASSLLQTIQFLWNDADVYNPNFHYQVNEALLVSIFGLDWESIFTEDGVGFLTQTPLDDGAELVYKIGYFYEYSGSPYATKANIQEVFGFVFSNNLDFDIDQIVWLLENYPKFQAMSQFYQGLPQSHFDEYGELPKAYLELLMEDTEFWEEVELDEYDPFEEYQVNLLIVNAQTDSAPIPSPGIENMEILGLVSDFSLIDNLTPFGGSSENPNGGPDLQYGYSGNTSIFTPVNKIKSEQDESTQEVRFKRLLWLLTILYPPLNKVSDDYFNFNKTNTDNEFEYYHEMLSKQVVWSQNMRNWLNGYLNLVSAEIDNAAGDIHGVVPPITLNRPKLNEHPGFTILINDTQVTNVLLLEESYSFDSSTGEWEFFAFVNVVDHFGLDDGDAIDYQNQFGSFGGFIGWWSLQHRYGWVPFKTDIWFKVKFMGKINI